MTIEPSQGSAPRPRSVTAQWINLLGLLAAGLVFVSLCRAHQTPLLTTVLCLLSLLAVIAVLERFKLGTHRRASTGLVWDRRAAFDPGRLAIKLLGSALTLGILALLYWLLPEYRQPFYEPFFKVLRLVGPLALALHVVYLGVLDRRLLDPQDGFWQAGCLLLGRWSRVDRRILRQHFLAWAVKGFFAPLMFCLLVELIGDLQRFDPGTLTRFAGVYEFCYSLVFLVDLTFTVAGYLFSMRLLDNHIQSTEPTALGWLVTLVCYRPLWDFFYSTYCPYRDDLVWGSWLSHSALYPVWGVAILLVLGVYAWTTVTFGLRFSNLTHRGILTNGPYRFSKHPGYLAKNLSWWLISVPFLVREDVRQTVRACLMLLMVNLIYYLRAVTEERHLSRDPTYVAYALWINQHGLLRGLGRWLPFLRYRPPGKES